MKRSERRYGFDYYLSDETIKDYIKKPVEMKLKWIYMGNLLQKQYPDKIIEIHNEFRRLERDAGLL